MLSLHTSTVCSKGSRKDGKGGISLKTESGKWDRNYTRKQRRKKNHESGRKGGEVRRLAQEEREESG